MAIKKSELYSSLWKSCDELRGGMDASQYKDYVLVLLFVKYVSDKYANQTDALIEVPKGGSFDDMVALKGQKDIGDRINKILAKLAEANNLKGVIDVADFNDADKLGKGKDMQDRLSNLVGIFQDPALNFSRNRAEGDDILGDAYEYLMRHFATESGKSKGQFYTPAEVSRIMAQVIGINKSKSKTDTIYDPACGSGSLLLKASDEAERGVTIYGQEMDNATAALAKMNMILHDNPTAEIWQDNSLSSPYFKDNYGNLKTFDYAVANPPFSTKAWSNGFDPQHDIYNRFEDGIPPNKNGDYAFLLHLVRSLKSQGKGAIILPHGVLFRGNAEAEIRKNLVKRGYIKGIIGLPANLFYGTGIPACIVVIDKENAEARKGIFIIDASKRFIKDGNKNRLRHQDIHKIVDVFNNQLEISKYSRMVPFGEIADERNDYNLNIPRYIDSQVSGDIQDIEAHLLGGIPNRDVDDLAAYWEVYPALRSMLFRANVRDAYSELIPEHTSVKKTIYEHSEFVSFADRVNRIFARWRDANSPVLKTMQVGVKPKQVIRSASENILSAFADIHLIDKYDVFQHLMTYWSDVMQDDVYMIAVDGWIANADLIPPSLIIVRYFAQEQAAIDQLEVEHEIVKAHLGEMENEHSGDDGILDNLKNGKGKITKGSVQSRVMELRSIILESLDATTDQKKSAKKIKKNFTQLKWQKGITDENDFFPELDVLYDYLLIVDAEAATKKKVKSAKDELNKKVHAKYGELSEVEVKSLVVDDKWMTTLDAQVKSEMERISQALTGRIKTLSERYQNPLPRLISESEELRRRVESHLQQMGFNAKPNPPSARI